MLVVLSRSLPDALGVEDLAGHARTRLGDGEVEDGVVLVLGVGELARVDSVEDGACVLERATLAARLDGGTGPTGVDEPGVGGVLLDMLESISA